MTNKDMILLLLETAAAIADPVNGLPDEKKAASLTSRLLEAVKTIYEDGVEALLA